MEAESKASAQCHELGEQILELRSKLKEMKSQAKTAETKVVTSSADPQLKRERDQLFVSAFSEPAYPPLLITAPGLLDSRFSVVRLATLP